MSVDLKKEKTYKVNVLHKEVVVRKAVVQVKANSVHEACERAKLAHETGHTALTPYTQSEITVMWDDCEYRAEHTREFDLATALSGEPVALRNGCKAWVLNYRHLKALGKDMIYGTVCSDNFDKSVSVMHTTATPLSLQNWQVNGRVFASEVEDPHDIVAMWEN